MTIITQINALPSSPYAGTGLVAVVITSGVPSYFQVIGTELRNIKSVVWYPDNPTSVEFTMRQMILVDDTMGTFMIQVVDNFLSTDDRGGKISFQMFSGLTLSFPVVTYGPVSKGPLWQSPNAGLSTGLD